MPHYWTAFLAGQESIRQEVDLLQQAIAVHAGSERINLEMEASLKIIAPSAAKGHTKVRLQQQL